MAVLTLTSKRQATFPRETCIELGLKAGDSLDLEPRTLAGEKVWVLRPRPVPTRRWLASLRAKAKPVADHSLNAVRRSVANGRGLAGE